MLRRKPKRRKRPDATKALAFPKRVEYQSGDAWLEIGGPGPARTKEGTEFLDWVHDQRCIVSEFSSDPCGGDVVQAAHQDEGKGIGMKTADSTCIPLCPLHHQLLGNGAPKMQFLKRLVHRLASRLVRVRYARRDVYRPAGELW